MKRYILLLCLLAVAACKPGDAAISGYVEGEFVRVAPSTGGVLAGLAVERGQQVNAGQDLFALDLTALQAGYEQALAASAQAQANWADLTKGARPEELAVIEKQKDAAEALLINAEKQWHRSETLAQTGAVSKAQQDADKASYGNAKARVEELAADLKAAMLGGREDQLAGAQLAVEQANQRVIQAQKLLQEAAPKAPAAGWVENTFFRPGEFVPAGTPVVSLLPPDNIKIRFFVSQKIVSSLRMGQPVTITCDGCEASAGATISFISSRAEYTPPVIYSVGSRDKLVFMVEAKPERFSEHLRPGLPVDIKLGTP